MKRATLTAKNCKRKGYHFKKVVLAELFKYDDFNNLENIEDYYDYAVPFKFGFIRVENKYDFPVPQIKVRNYTHYIQTYRDLDFEVGDMVLYGRDKWYIEDINYTEYNSGSYDRIKHYFLTLK